MKLPRTYFENLSPGKYRDYLKVLPKIKKESTKAVTMLIFTLLGLSLLGIFAISPTLSTIIELRKQLEDSTFVYEKLTTKINNLSSLQEEYEIIKNDLSYVFAAVPKTSAASTLVGQIEAIAQGKNVKINSLRIGKAELTNNKQNQTTPVPFVFSLEAEGAYDDLINFTNSLSSFDRLVAIDSITLNKDSRRDVLLLTVKGKGYFKK